MVQVNAALADGGERFVGHAAGDHLVVKVVVAHVAGAAVRVRYHHDLFYPQLIDGDNQTAHGGVESGDYQPSCVLDDFRIAILQSECGGQQFRQPRVHARQHRQFLVGVLVGEEFLVAFLCHECLVVFDNLVNHNC